LLTSAVVETVRLVTTVAMEVDRECDASECSMMDLMAMEKNEASRMKQLID
jgi:hypothetical protein